MYNKKSVILMALATLCAMAFAAKDRVLPEQETNFSLMSFMARSNSLFQSNPVRSLDCFNYYLPEIEKIAKKYESEYSACIDASSVKRAEAEAATQGQRDDLASRADQSCQALSACSVIDSAEKVFECFVKAGSESSKIMYNINADASEHLVDLQEQFRLIENVENKCTTEAKRVYEKDSAKAYEDLNNCILGISEPPTPTEAPIESTVNPESPESTANPENPESTESPEVTEAPENPESTESPESPESTESPESPESTESPESPESTESPESPESTESPESPESTEGTEAPESTEDPSEIMPEEDLSVLRKRLHSLFRKYKH